MDFPESATEASLKTLMGGYLLDGETPYDMYSRVAKTAAKALNRPDLEKPFFNAMWKNWLCPASPILANLGTNRGLPISCNSIHLADSLDSIYQKQHELAMLSKNGAGVGIYFGDVRGRGAPITGNGSSEGTIPFMKGFDTTTIAVNQGSTRRGASAIYLPIDHVDIEEFLRIRRPNGDVNRQCLNIHQGVCISNEFMTKVENGDPQARAIFTEVCRTRVETGEPYIFFSDNVNQQNPACYTAKGLNVKTSNICSEITLYTDPEHTFVCCLSSLNLAKWEEWKDTDLPYLATYFLDAVLTEYIAKAKNIVGLEASVRSAEKGRAIGIGVLGWHTLLQSEGTAFDSFRATLLNRAIFARIRSEAERATKSLAVELGEPEWCVGFNRRNTHLLAVAPTASNSIISGNVSAGIEPLPGNAYQKKTAKGVFIEQNPILRNVLQSIQKDTPEVWNNIAINDGSVQHLDFLTEEQKLVFKTAYEIDQMAIINQAADRQAFIDQSQSLNLFFPANLDAKEFYQVHLHAWKRGIKTLYYLRSSSTIKADVSSRSKDDECAACES